jgi:TetR/AcrR family transcriptional repressor of nem operon
VVQKAIPSSREIGRREIGRRPAFDREAVVSSAMRLFWAKGFAATTLNDLEAETGVDRSTIYNSFGGKNGLYRSAAAAYIDLSEELLFEPLSRGTEGIVDIVEFLARLADVLGSDSNPPGCLIVNDMAADRDEEATDRYLACLEGGFRTALERAAGAGEIDPGTSVRRAQFMTAAILGVNIVHRSAADAARAQTLIDGLRAEVESWPRTTGRQAIR